MMKTILAASLLLVACTDNVETPTDPSYTAMPVPSSVLPESTKIIVSAHENDDGVTVSAPESNQFDLSDSPCACTTSECLSKWVLDNIGCDIIVDFRCADGQRAGFAQCVGADHLSLKR